MYRSFTTAITLVTICLFVLGCRSKQEQKPAFISTHGGFSVCLENLPNNSMNILLEKLRDQIGDTVQMGYPYIKANFDKYALFTIRNDSARSLYIWSHDSLFLYVISQIHEAGTPRSANQEVPEPCNTPIRIRPTKFEIKPKTSKSFYLPFCTTYRRFGKDTRFAIDMLAFNRYYTFDSSEVSDNHHLAIAITIDSLKNVHIKERDAWVR